MVLDEREPNDYQLRKRIQSEEAEKRNKPEPLHQRTESLQDYWKRVAAQGKYDELPEVRSGEVHSVREMRFGSRRRSKRKK